MFPSGGEKARVSSLAPSDPSLRDQPLEVQELTKTIQEDLI